MNSNFQEHGGNITAEARRLGVKETELLDASASIVPFPTPDLVQLRLSNAIANGKIRHYPDCNYEALTKIIGECHNIEPGMVLPGNGAAELLTWSAREAAATGESTLLAPGFADYERALNCWNADFIYEKLPLTWSKKTPQAFPIRPQTQVAWVNNPHNPTGQLWSKESMKTLLDKNKLVICDEAFLPLVPGGEKESLIPLVPNYQNLIVIRSLTKLFGIAGLRLGYAVSSPKRLREWKLMRDPWPINSLAELAGITLLEDKIKLTTWIDTIHSWIKKENKWMADKLSLMAGIQPYPSSTNYLLIKGDKSLVSLRETLSQKNILLRDCRSFKGLGSHWLRISIQTRKENQRIISAMQEILN